MNGLRRHLLTGYNFEMDTLGNHARLFFVLCALMYVTMFAAPFFTLAETMEERRIRLEQELAIIEKDIVEKRGVLSEKQKERTSL